MNNLDKVRQVARDLRRQEPRPSDEELGGESHAARTVDKCRASLLGCNGDYQFGCPLDQLFFEQTGIDQDEFRDYVATGATDQEIAAWIRQHKTVTK